MTVIPLNTKPSRASEIEARFIKSSDMKPVLSLSYLVKGWLSTAALTVMFGGSHSGKTFVALDLSFHIATSMPWRGFKVRGGPVIYVAAEGGRMIQNRFCAVRDNCPEFGNADVTLLPTALNLHEEEDAVALCEALPIVNPALIVIDTLARSMGDGDENTAKDMNRFIRSCDLIREVTGAHVMVVHHTGKDASRGARGSNTLYAATDTEVRITAEGEIDCTKQRDMSYPESLYFKLRSVTLGKDEDGDDVSSAIVEEAEKSTATCKPLSGKNEVAVQALQDALRGHGEVRQGNDFPVNRKVVHIDHWRKACADHGLTSGSSDSAARTAFMRAKVRLIDLNEVREWGDHVWRVQEND